MHRHGNGARKGKKRPLVQRGGYGLQSGAYNLSRNPDFPPIPACGPPKSPLGAARGLPSRTTTVLPPLRLLPAWWPLQGWPGRAATLLRPHQQTTLDEALAWPRPPHGPGRAAGSARLRWSRPGCRRWPSSPGSRRKFISEVRCHLPSPHPWRWAGGRVCRALFCGSAPGPVAALSAQGV